MQNKSLFSIFNLLGIFASVASAAVVSYETILSNILNGNISTNNGVSALVDWVSEQPHQCGLDVSIASHNNGEVMKDAVMLYEYALAGEKWGDALLLKHFILYNGQAHVYLNSSDLKYDLSRLLDGNETMRDIWVESSTNPQLKEIYQSVDLVPPVRHLVPPALDLLHKRDDTQFDGSHVLDNDDFQNLGNWLGVDGNATAQDSPGDYCWGSYCVSWSTRANFILN